MVDKDGAMECMEGVALALALALALTIRVAPTDEDEVGYNVEIFIILGTVVTGSTENGAGE